MATRIEMLTGIPQRAVRDNCSRCDGRRGGVPGNENIVDGKRVCDYCHAEVGTPSYM